MTKQEYIGRQRVHWERANQFKLVWLVVFIGAITAMISLTRYLDHHPESAWMGNLCGAGLLVVLLGSILWMVLTARRYQREFGVQCRSCGKNVLNSQIAIATGNCGFCGEKLFD